MHARYMRSQSATVRAWVADGKTSYVGHDVTFLPRGRGAVDTKILSIDPGERIFATCVDENGNVYQFGQKLRDFTNYAKHQIAAREHLISTELDELDAVRALRQEAETLIAELAMGVDEKTFNDAKEKLREYDRSIAKWKKHAEVFDPKHKNSSKINHKQYRAEINHLQMLKKKKRVKLQDEIISNFCCTFDKVFIPAFATKQAISNDKAKGIPKSSKDNLNRFSQETLRKMITQKVEAEANMFSERDLAGYGSNPPDPKWPKGARIAISFVVNYEEGGTRGRKLKTAGGQPRKARDMNMETQYEYGTRVGVWRILRMFEQKGWKFTCYAVGKAVELCPEPVKAMARAGHEIASHNYRWIDYQTLDEATEREHVNKAIDAIEKTVGKPPRGWYTGRISPRSRAIVVEEYRRRGIKLLYDCDAYNDELPYHLTLDNGESHLVIPYTLDANDMKVGDLR
ncbi:hypothetical protein HDU96_001320 [Phlyctochytrium bullatum]|nr:hypothetical protein HDU96_001320 [Phlyctochytrium bullatum]